MAAFRTASAWVTVAGFLMCASTASAGTALIDQMMVDLASDSAQAADTIRRVYQQHLDILALREYGELAGALDNGGLVPLPANPLRYNLVPRLDGPHPIGEKDLANQSSYISARAATVGALLDIASRVRSGPLEVTSLVRHGDYQDSLRTTNPNAATSVPMHTMGLAVDIALINSPLETVYEIRDVLQRMKDAGDILFIGEQKQLVFHVVPHPSRIGHFNEVYARAVGEPLTSRSAGVVAFIEAPRLLPHPLVPRVTTEIIAVLPAEGPLQNLWIEPSTTTSTKAERSIRPRRPDYVLFLFAALSVPLALVTFVVSSLRQSSTVGIDVRSARNGGPSARVAASAATTAPAASTTSTASAVTTASAARVAAAGRGGPATR